MPNVTSSPASEGKRGVKALLDELGRPMTVRQMQGGKLVGGTVSAVGEPTTLCGCLSR